MFCGKSLTKYLRKIWTCGIVYAADCEIYWLIVNVYVCTKKQTLRDVKYKVYVFGKYFDTHVFPMCSDSGSLSVAFYLGKWTCRSQANGILSMQNIRYNNLNTLKIHKYAIIIFYFSWIDQTSKMILIYGNGRRSICSILIACFIHNISLGWSNICWAAEVRRFTDVQQWREHCWQFKGGKYIIRVHSDAVRYS